MGFLKKMMANLEDLKGFLKETKNKIGGFPPIRGRMESMERTCFNKTKVQNWNIQYTEVVKEKLVK